MRGSLSHKDAMQGFGFKEGIVVVDKSRVMVFQYPAPKDKPKEQSDPFTAVVWDVTKLDKDLNVIPLQENEQPTRIVLRLCRVENGRPGLLKEKDFDNPDADPKDLGSEVDTEGNCLYLEEGQRAEGSGWSKMEESLTTQCGFKEAVVARGIATDYEGMIVHLKTVEGDKYVPKRGAKAGQEVQGYNLIADKIIRAPYEKNSKVKVGGEGGETTKAKRGKSNGEADEGDSGKGGGGDEKLVTTAAKVLTKADSKFKKTFFTGEPVDKKKFESAFIKELWKQVEDDKLQEEVMTFIKTGDGLKAVAREFGFKAGEDSVTFPEED